MEDPTPGHRYRLVSKATGHQLEVGNIRDGEGANEIWHVTPGGQGWSWEVESADIGLRLKTGMTLASSLSDAGDGTVGSHPVPGNNLVRSYSASVSGVT
jgi:hypothetical protein